MTLELILILVDALSIKDLSHVGIQPVLGSSQSMRPGEDNICKDKQDKEIQFFILDSLKGSNVTKAAKQITEIII